MGVDWQIAYWGKCYRWGWRVEEERGEKCVHNGIHCGSCVFALYLLNQFWISFNICSPILREAALCSKRGFIESTLCYGCASALATNVTPFYCPSFAILNKWTIEKHPPSPLPSMFVVDCWGCVFCKSVPRASFESILRFFYAFPAPFNFFSPFSFLFFLTSSLSLSAALAFARAMTRSCKVAQWLHACAFSNDKHIPLLCLALGCVRIINRLFSLHVCELKEKPCVCAC